ncbi:MAG: thioredoxin family protein [Actinomycetota bacterium]|jgi:hypothetical protein|nr:thioredoxin family protein [Actinomycetota bacterium]
MSQTITILQTPGCPNVTLMRQRLADALAQLDEPAPQVAIEEVADLDEAARRGFYGSPALVVDGADVFASPGSPPAFACRTYHTGAGIEGAPSVDQIVAALTNL